MQTFNELNAQPLTWLWPNWIPLGKITMISGEGGVGKSMLAVDLAAAVSLGDELAGGKAVAQGSVIMLSPQDNPHDTILPRLKAAGAELSKVYLFEGTPKKNADGEELRPFDLAADLDQLEQAIIEAGDCKLVLIDPLNSYFGGRRRTDMRAFVEKLCELAERLGVAVVVFQQTTSGSQRATSWATAFTGAARVAFSLVVDPLNVEKRLLLLTKHNLGSLRTGKAFLIGSKESGDPAITWYTGTEPRTLEEVRRQASGRVSPQEKLADAEKFLRRELATGKKANQYLFKLAKQENVLESSLRQAYKLAGGTPYRKDLSDTWIWEWPKSWPQPNVPPEQQTNLWGKKSYAELGFGDIEPGGHTTLEAIAMRELERMLREEDLALSSKSE